MGGPEFLNLAVYLWDLLVMQLLPLISVMLAVIFIYKIGESSRITLGKWMKRSIKKLKTR